MTTQTPTRLDREIAAHETMLETYGDEPLADPFDEEVRLLTIEHLDGLRRHKRGRVYHRAEHEYPGRAAVTANELNPA